MRACIGIIAVFCMVSVASATIPAEKGPETSGRNLRFTISLPASLPRETVTGRVFLLVAKECALEPRLQPGDVSVFGVDVHGAKPREDATIDSCTPGFPEHSLGELAPGDYYVQAVLNVYTEFHREDGHVIWAHMDQWEGQNFRISPGNLISEPQKLHLDPRTAEEFKVALNKVIPPIEAPVDTKWVKHVKLKSKLLSRFWDHPIYIGATILLPKGYDANSTIRYPVIYLQGHFGLGAPFGFDTASDKPGTKSWARQREEWIAEHPKEWASGHLNMPEPPPPDMRAQQEGDLLDLLRHSDGALLPVERGHEFYEAWNTDDFPRMIAVTLQHPTPYYDDSYAINSANCGPYGDAIIQELIPYIEEHFRVIGQAYARVLAGGSTGGWESLALQTYHPDFFGGTWSFCPDSVDFHRYYGVDIYDDKNAYVEQRVRSLVGAAELNRQLGRYAAVLGMQDGFLQWWDYTPTGPDGYPVPVWDLSTGKIDRAVVQYMRERGYDLRDYLERNWPRIGAKLAGKLHVICGDDDDFYSNLAVYLLEDSLENTKDPYYGGSFTYGRPMKGHCWQPTTNAELVRTMARFIADHAPSGAPSQWLSQSNGVYDAKGDSR